MDSLTEKLVTDMTPCYNWRTKTYSPRVIFVFSWCECADCEGWTFGFILADDRDWRPLGHPWTGNWGDKKMFHNIAAVNVTAEDFTKHLDATTAPVVDKVEVQWIALPQITAPCGTPNPYHPDVVAAEILH